MIWRITAAIALSLMPSAAALADVQNEIDVEIMIGRTEVMHDQTARGLVVLGVRQASTDNEQFLPSDPARNQFSRLNDAVVRYNNLRDLACASRVINNPLCAEQRFMPQWFSNVPRSYVSNDDLRHMAEDVQGETMPLWSAVCERAIARSGDKDFCAIE